MGVLLSEAGAKKLKAIVAKVDAMKFKRGGQPVPTGQPEETILGYITGCDLSGRRYSFVRVTADASTDEPDVIVDGGALKYRIFQADPPHIHTAYELNGARGIQSGIVVAMTFAGYRPDDALGPQPVYHFSYEQTQTQYGVPLHDHRDASQGGFAFAVYHPGTSLPQQAFFP